MLLTLIVAVPKSLISQSPNTPIYSPLDSLEEDDEHEDFDEDYIYYMPHDFWPEDYDTIPKISVTRQVKVRYTTKASLYVRLDLNGYAHNEVVLLLIAEDDSTTVLTLDVNDELVLTNLPVNQYFEIAVVHDEALPYLISSFNTYEDYIQTDVISLYPHMFDEVSYWLRYPDSSDLFQFVNIMSDWHHLEKTYFIQAFVYYGKELADEVEGNLPPDPRLTGTLDGDCLCRPLRLTVSIDKAPSQGRYPINTKEGNWMESVPKSDEITERMLGKHGKGWHDYMISGPGKGVGVWADTPKCTGQGSNYRQGFSTDSEQFHGTGNNFPHEGGNNAMLKYVFACIGVFNFQPDDCACNPNRQPEVRVCYRYSSRAEVYSDIKSGWCVSGRSAVSAAYDHVLVAYTTDDTDLDKMEIAAGGSVFAGAGCSTNPNWVSFTLAWANLGLTAVKAIKSPKKWFELPLILLAGNKLAKQLKDLPTSPIESIGDCGEKIAIGPDLVNGCLTLKLDINHTSVVLMQNNYNVHVHVKGKFQASSIVRSSYGLSGIMFRADPDVVGDVCCGTGSAVYSIRARAPELGHTALQNWVGSNFLAWGVDIFDDIYPITGQWGFRGGGVRPDCKLEIEHDTGEKPVSTVEMNKMTKSDILLKQVGEFLYFKTTDVGTAWQLELYDLNGKSLDSVKGTGAELQMYPLDALPIPGGMYISRLSTQTASETIKIVKPY